MPFKKNNLKSHYKKHVIGVEENSIKFNYMSKETFRKRANMIQSLKCDYEINNLSDLKSIRELETRFFNKEFNSIKIGPFIENKTTRVAILVNNSPYTKDIECCICNTLNNDIISYYPKHTKNFNHFLKLIEK